MKLPFIRPATAREAKAGDADPKSPHYFQEVSPGVVPCALCRRRSSDSLHLAVEKNESPHWGFES